VPGAGLPATLSRAGRQVAGGLADVLLPQTCVLCGTWISGGASLACPACSETVRAAFTRPYCPRCGRTLPRAAIHADHCGRCRTEHFWNLRGIARVSTYEPGVRQALLELKFRGQERIAAYLADRLAEAIRSCSWGPALDALVPVPMHWLRRWQRPCDHALLLTRELARRLRLPVMRIVRRTQHRPSQTTLLSKSQRFENVQGSFGLPRWRPPDLALKSVCVVDNLILTGATVCEMSKTLRRGGARRIYAATVARAAPPGDPPSRIPPDWAGSSAGQGGAGESR
jgi:ComF family protein